MRYSKSFDLDLCEQHFEREIEQEHRGYVPRVRNKPDRSRIKGPKPWQQGRVQHQA